MRAEARRVRVRCALMDADSDLAEVNGGVPAGVVEKGHIDGIGVGSAAVWSRVKGQPVLDLVAQDGG